MPQTGHGSVSSPSENRSCLAAVLTARAILTNNTVREMVTVLVAPAWGRILLLCEYRPVMALVVHTLRATHVFHIRHFVGVAVQCFASEVAEIRLLKASVCDAVPRAHPGRDKTRQVQNG